MPRIAGGDNGDRALVAIVDQEPTFRLGLAIALEAKGLRVAHPHCPLTWLPRHPGARALAMSARYASDLTLLGRAVALRPNLAAVAIVDQLDKDALTTAAQHGVTNLVERAADPDDIVNALLHALNGRTVLPTPLAHQVLSGAAVPTRPPRLSDQDLTILGLIGAGVRMPEIAERLCCSERTLYRWQKQLYRRLGARDRATAIALGMVWGLIEPPAEMSGRCQSGPGTAAPSGSG